jgi:hypothetical protein
VAAHPAAGPARGARRSPDPGQPVPALTSEPDRMEEPVISGMIEEWERKPNRPIRPSVDRGLDGRGSQMIDEPMTTDESTPPAEDEDAIGWTVPNFFGEDDEPALRKQVGWAERHLGLSDGFYAQFLRAPESSFRDWRLGQGELSSDRQDGLREFWRMMRHLISWMGMDEQRVSGLLEHQVPLVNEWGYRHPKAPPWSGTSLRSYLEERGADVLPDVEYWVESVRLGH